MPCCRFKPSTKSQINKCSVRIGTVSNPLILPTQLPLSKAWATVHHLMVLLGIVFMRFGAHSEIVLTSIYLTRTRWIHHYQQLIPWPCWIKLGHCTALEWANLPMVTTSEASVFSNQKPPYAKRPAQDLKVMNTKCPRLLLYLRWPIHLFPRERQLPPFAFSCEPSISCRWFWSPIWGDPLQSWDRWGQQSAPPNTVHGRHFPVWRVIRHFTDRSMHVKGIGAQGS